MEQGKKYSNYLMCLLILAITIFSEHSLLAANHAASGEIKNNSSGRTAQGILVWEGVLSGQDYSGNYIQNYLTNAGFNVQYTDVFPSDMIGYDAVFLSFGNYGTNGSTNTFFTDQMAAVVQAYLEAGGKVYLEGGDALGWDQRNNSTLHNLFGLSSVADGGTNVINDLRGQSSALTAGMRFTSSTQVNNHWIDRYTVSTGTLAFREVGYGRVAVQNVGSYSQKTFCFSYALAELTDGASPSTKDSLLSAIVNFFDPPTPTFPEIDISPTSFSVSLVTADTTTKTLTISNLGDADLTFTLDEVPSGAMSSIKYLPVEPQKNHSTFIHFKKENEPESSQQIDLTGMFLKHTEITEPEPSAASTARFTGEFSDSIKYDLYGSVNSSFIGFGSATPIYAATRFTATGNFTLTHVRARYRTEVSTSPVEVRIYADNAGNPGTLLHSDSFSGTEYQSSAGKLFLLELSQSVAFTAGTEFWIVLYFQDVSFPMGASTDGVNQTGRMKYSSNGSTWSALGDVIADGNDDAWIIRALQKFDLGWLSLSPTAGTVNPLNDINVNVRFDAAGLSPGTYNGTIRVSNNDQDENPLSVPVTLTVTQSVLLDSVRIFLQGPYLGPGMNTYLADNDLLPHNQPFNSTPDLGYNGTESVTSFPAGVVDWVLLELREADETTIAGRRAAFVMSDGWIKDTDGSSGVRFLIPEGNYYVVIHHRNHLSVMSATTWPLSAVSSGIVDFTSSISSAYTTGPAPLRDLGGGVFGAPAGDGNSDGGVDGLDYNKIWVIQNGTAWDYSKFADFNLDGSIDASDSNSLWLPNNGTATQVP